MGEWKIIQGSVDGYPPYVSYETYKDFESIIGGKAYHASELGFTTISGLWSGRTVTGEDLNKLAVYVPNGSVWGLIMYSGGSYGSADCTTYAIDLNVKTPNAVSIGSCPYCADTPVRIYKGDGFSILANLTSQNSYYRRQCWFDIAYDVKTGKEFSVFCSGGAFNLESTDLPYSNIAHSPVLDGGRVNNQNDGSLYVELIERVYYNTNNKSALESVWISKHIYNRFIDYSSANTEKVVLINNRQYQSLLGTSIYFCLE